MIDREKEDLDGVVRKNLSGVPPQYWIGTGRRAD